MRAKDLEGRRFGRLIAENRAENRGKRTMWNCLCDCGNRKAVGTADLLKGTVLSCGCYRKETATKQALANAEKKFAGRKITSAGYIAVHAPDHPNAVAGGYVLEHRLIAEEHAGRLLEANEVVHHINHIRTDNRVENLQIMTASEHQSMHMKERHKSRSDSDDTE